MAPRDQGPVQNSDCQKTSAVKSSISSRPRSQRQARVPPIVQARLAKSSTLARQSLNPSRYSTSSPTSQAPAPTWREPRQIAMLPAVPTKQERAIADAQVQANSTAIAMLERRLKMICAFGRTVSSASTRRRSARTSAYVIGDHDRSRCSCASILKECVRPRSGSFGLVINDRGCASPNLVSEAASL